jgi:hypothetical protein
LYNLATSPPVHKISVILTYELWVSTLMLWLWKCAM